VKNKNKIKVTEFKKSLNECVPNFKDKANDVFLNNAMEEYCMIRTIELVTEAMDHPNIFNSNLIRAIQLLNIARIRHEARNPKEKEKEKEKQDGAPTV